MLRFKRVIFTQNMICLAFYIADCELMNIGTVQYTVCLKNVQSLTGYSFNTHPPIFTTFGKCHQKRLKKWLQVSLYQLASRQCW